MLVLHKTYLTIWTAFPYSVSKKQQQNGKFLILRVVMPTLLSKVSENTGLYKDIWKMEMKEGIRELLVGYFAHEWLMQEF